MNTDLGGRNSFTLSAIERRVLGVLIEKQKTNPADYPMTPHAIVASANLKLNRNPITRHTVDQIEDALNDLLRIKAVECFKGSGMWMVPGTRSDRWKHSLYGLLNLKNRPVEMEILANLMLQGPQFVDRLHARYARMNQNPLNGSSYKALDYLSDRGLIVYFPTPGRRLGMYVAHGFYPSGELEHIKLNHGM